MAVLPKVNEHFIYKSKSGYTYLALRIDSITNKVNDIKFTEIALLVSDDGALNLARRQDCGLYTRGGWSLGDRMIGVVPEKTLEEYIYNNPEYFI